MRIYLLIFPIGFGFVLHSCQISDSRQRQIVQTSAAGDKLTPIEPLWSGNPNYTFALDTLDTRQIVTGFGGAFTESSAHLLTKLSPEKRVDIISKYFDEAGADYSLCRTHMNSCDFSLDHYSYASIAGDTFLDSFSIQPDLDDLVPMIQMAQEASADGFNIIASPWTAPPWMKDNADWYGGQLLPEFSSTWADFFVRYDEAYAKLGIDIWAYTVENEPLGNDANWESMHYTPESMGAFIKNHLGPAFNENGVDARILIYDQNRGEELVEWSKALLLDQELEPYVYGTAVHWYTSTIDWMGESLTETHEFAPEKHIIHTEGCIDAEVPHWQDDAWYWSKNATDWGFDWAPEEDKADHPKYVPTYRYARDMIGCLNNWVEGWVDWNMVLDRTGGPNLADNWCIAPVIVDTASDEVYYTPLYFIMSHFSKYIRPGAKVLSVDQQGELLVAAVKNENGSIACVVLNQPSEKQEFAININGEISYHIIDGQAIQTIVID
ncbi:MAG: glycoside hydrolase family 30 protein [Flavobacteriales bacterium]|nr:glycoside hydrolase family 30 protein [Flavobacteriales bacterium]